MRKIVMSGLVAAAAVLGCAGPAFAGTGTAGTAGTVTPAVGGKSAETALLQAIAARYPAKSAVARIAASYVERLSARQEALPARPEASGGATEVTALTGISCASPTACLSIGEQADTSSDSGDITPIAARLHAGTWKSVPVKAPKAADFTLLEGVSCKAATYCLVVGDAFTNSGPTGYALTWDGTKLTPVAAPPVPKAYAFGLVASVSCVAVKSCVAIGIGLNAAAGEADQLIWTWNGTKWALTTVSPADPSADTEYTGLHCFSLTSCVAIGDRIDQTSNGDGTSTPVAASWDGTAFTDLKAPVPAGVANAAFAGLSCVSAHSCAVVGAADTNDKGTSLLGFAEVWNGKTWTVTKWSGPAGDDQAELVGVSCTSAVRCIAVGGHGTENAATPAALAWGGSKWTVLKVPGPGGGKAAFFEDISCPVNGKCVTTGESGKLNTDTPEATAIAGYWNGRAWKYGPMLPAAAA